jgi:hypothetical protein
MRLATLALVVILNLSSATLHNVMVVEGDNCTEIGTISKGEYRKMETLSQDSIRVIFTLGQKREGWLGTEKMAIRDTIKINDNTQTFELEICVE